MRKLIMVIAIVANLVPVVANADTATLVPTDDSAVWYGYPNGNYGNVTFFTIAYFTGPDWINTVIKFDLSDYSGASVNNAYIRSYVFDADETLPMDGVRIARNTGDWSEYTVTWNNKPGITDSTSISGPSSYGWWSIDVTAWVQDIVNGTEPDYGFQIYRDDSDTPGGFIALSKDSPFYRPTLELDYTLSAVESASLGEIKAAFR